MIDPTISVEELRRVVGKTQSPLIVDVRDADELAEGFIPGAIHIPYLEIEHYAPMVLPDKAAWIVTYCATGRRSGIAARKLIELGYQDVKNLIGGFEAWSG